MLTRRPKPRALLKLQSNDMPINYKLYPKDWKSRIVPAVLQRANHCCEQCGVENYKVVYSVRIAGKRKGKTVYRQLWLWTEPKLVNLQVKKVTVVLTVAHLDHNAHDHTVKIERLKALCQLCHLRLDSEVKAQRRRCHPFCQFPNCGPNDLLPWCIR
jgi:hypothetical protein